MLIALMGDFRMESVKSNAGIQADSMVFKI